MRDVRSVKPGENVNELLVWKSLHIGCRWASLVLVTPRVQVRMLHVDGTRDQSSTQEGFLTTQPPLANRSQRSAGVQPDPRALCYSVGRPTPTFHPQLTARRHVVVQVWFWLEGG